jgi:hypothetical protein
MMLPMVDAAVSPEASSLDVTKLPAPDDAHTLYSQHEHTHPEGTPFHLHSEDERVPTTYDDIDARLTEIENMLKSVVQFVNDARAAIEAMPSLPFMPKFPKGIGK